MRLIPAIETTNTAESMNTKIDVKSALLGLVLGVIATAATGAVSSPTQIGRYQVAGAGNHAIVLDTVTGQLWANDVTSRYDNGFSQPMNAEKE
jgi:hypothetical protein